MRSSMSLPAFFTPVRERGGVLVDGGLVNNLPVDVARQMGADIVIAVHLPLPRLDPNSPLSSVAVLQRSASVSIAVNELRTMENADILLKADVERFTMTDYKLHATIEAAAYKAPPPKPPRLPHLH